MSETNIALPEGYLLHSRAGHWLASKTEEGRRYSLRNKKGEEKYWLSQERAAAYCCKHAAQGASFREEVKL